MFQRAEPIIKSSSSETTMNADGTMGYYNLGISISFKVIDTDFEETSASMSYVDAIIDVYERRNLNVASALAIYIHNNSSHIHIAILKGDSRYQQYMEEVNKYLTLI